MEKLNKVPGWIFTVIIAGVTFLGGLYAVQSSTITHIDDVEREFREELVRHQNLIDTLDERQRELEPTVVRFVAIIERMDHDLKAVAKKIDILVERSHNHNGS